MRKKLIHQGIIILFHDYNNEFTTATSKDGDTESYKGYCEIIKRSYFCSIKFDDYCYKVSKYLEYIKDKNDGNEYEHCIYLN
ncbi:hypothetical protein POVCU2_0065780 [Plasmodium ovale curtisi]|uniref:PIR Superfamily Protein n=1 Tax=Plasmodium ovale curtisi TaxID=864141 RepID=A0A1A8WH73_PLAOA|nr:hypothetical protein POVCU2_0065780 [Plasmodium ovale curtisi]